MLNIQSLHSLLLPSLPRCDSFLRASNAIVQAVRTLEPTGRFLKEDPHTGLWMEVVDERAWKKASQALRESAPEIRAER